MCVCCFEDSLAGGCLSNENHEENYAFGGGSPFLTDPNAVASFDGNPQNVGGSLRFLFQSTPKRVPQT